MLVKATKKMMKELNKRAITNYCIDFFQFLELPIDAYKAFFLDSPLDHMNDYNAAKNVMNVIKVVYKPEMYSLDHYITTNDLIREYRPGDTAERFLQRVINAVEI